ncbi:hypothetical protein K7395_24760 [Streptomyces filamentosus]|uniref:Phage protein n=2 Tax=Streptomyces filamentosus TaxID=67294 RepID=A0ABY4V650_STRFL|nr:MULTISPECIES: hypothetical protein [Streptomyces]EFE74567.1 phage protein [Streptomyces filamentosus NRRL 15998]ESU46494.1 hypothetical protein P376_5530 [Streptomyces sp. HCCB10043]EWS91667.1 hypothetical protein SSIG_02114 [Streptomyces filamentosus NRRL 11379]MYR78695.1 hypothetical protein [Streptomyces sp. SID5466]USC49701.1 hypothetical protein K7395_24760 [Streptomyces filamentosus]
MGEALQAALAERYDSLSASLRDRLIGFVLDAFDSLGSYRDADAALFIERVLPIVLGVQQQLGQITDAYLSAVIADMMGGAAAPAGVAVAEELRGVPPEDVYRRPFVQVWTALSRGHDVVDAIGQGRTRLLSITETDLQLARTHAARDSMERGGARYFRRRLSSGKNCALCTIASTQRYRVENLMPIHPGCHCKPEPLPGNRDPGHVIDEQLLKDAHAAIARDLGESDAGGRAPDYREVIITREHGEYGPLLAVRRQNFTGPDDLPSP